jgi:hypothetical protein
MKQNVQYLQQLAMLYWDQYAFLLIALLLLALLVLYWLALVVFA